MKLGQVKRTKDKLEWHRVRVEPGAVMRIEPGSIDPFYGPLSVVLMKDGSTIPNVTGSTYQVEQALFGR